MVIATHWGIAKQILTDCEKDRMTPNGSEDRCVDPDRASAQPEPGISSSPPEDCISGYDIQPRSATPLRPSVIVVGAGVSGCACAACLAAAGAQVLLVNSALDILGLPGYGPGLFPAQGGWSELAGVLSDLPAPLRWAWLSSASVVKNGSPLLLVDRRAVSLETKRALEGMAGIDFRQGLVVEIRPGVEGMADSDREGALQTEFAAPGARPELASRPSSSELATRSDMSMATSPGTAATVTQRHTRGGSSRVAAPFAGRLEVETAFGEVFSADAVVIAVGLGLGGRIAVGSDGMTGGRYGEVAADALQHSLETQGVSFERVHVRVGTEVCGSRVGSFEQIAGVLADSEDTGAIRVSVILEGLQKDGGDAESVPGLDSIRDALSRIAGGGRMGDVMKAEEWPVNYPAAPHRMGGLRPSRALLPRQLGQQLGKGSRSQFGPRSRAELEERSRSRLEEGFRAQLGERLEDQSGNNSLGGPNKPASSPVLGPASPETAIAGSMSSIGIASSAAANAVTVQTGAHDPVLWPRLDLEPLVSPDCGSTAELYVRPGEDVNAAQNTPASRLEHVIAANIIVERGADGRILGLPGVWAAGQVAGTLGYLESLRSGIEVASAVMNDLEPVMVDRENGVSAIPCPADIE